MGFDRNTVIGFALLAVLFMGYFWYVSSGQKAAAELQKLEEAKKAALKPKVDSVAYQQEQQKIQAVKDSVDAGEFSAKGTETFTYVENNLVKLTFSNKGGWLKQVELKNFKGPDSLLVKLGGGPNSEFGYTVVTGKGGGVSETEKLYFNAAVVNKTPDGAQTISYQASAGGKTITHSFVVKPDDYMVDAKIDLVGTDQLITQQAMNVHWSTEAHQQQHDVVYEKTQTRLVYRTGDEYDYNAALSAISEKLEKPTQWIGLKQQFFNSTLLSKSSINGVQADVLPLADTVHTEVATLKVTGRIPMPAGTNSVLLQIYNGPNDYYILKKYDNDMHNIVDLGSGVFSFVKYINRWLILPVFNFLTKMMGAAAMGWAILVLTIIIRLLIAPLTYTSYLSGAKMKALRPEIDAMKARVGDDQQKVSMEQMKLFREAGVNPLGGCIPALFQIPIFFALYSFFNSNIALRGIPFLWSHDLSSYDSILNFSFTIPFYGNHVSLFTITACLTSFLISMYSMSTTPDTGNPMMKYMPYIFPFMMLFIFNKLPSALTWYYTVSNAITLILQFVIQNYIIDHKKILAQIAANRSTPKKKSKIQERMEAMQQTQQKVEEMKKKNQGKK